MVGTVAAFACHATPPASPKTPPALAVYEYGWRADLGASTAVRLAVGASTVFAAGDDGLTAFAATDGRKTWSTNDVGSSATIGAAGNLLYVVAPGHADALGRAVAGRLVVRHQADGRPAWTIDALPDPIVDPLVRGDTVFLAAGVDVRVYSAHDGALSWHAALGAAPVALAADGDRLFVALANGTLVSLDTRAHAVSWQTALESPARSLAAADRRVFVCAEDGALSAYHQDRGGPAIWQVRRVGAVGRPAVDDRLVYVAQFDNTARAYDAGNGTERWRLRLGSRPEPGVQLAATQVFIPLLTGPMATSLARAGQPSGQVLLLAPAGEPAPADQRLEASGVSADAGVIFRVTRPSSHTAWTLSAVKRK